jgi:hypothetical protein
MICGGSICRETICRETIRGSILPQQKSWRDERPSEHQQKNGEQTPATSGHSQSPEIDCLLRGIRETEAILVGGRKQRSDGCHQAPVDFSD